MTGKHEILTEEKSTWKDVIEALPVDIRSSTLPGPTGTHRDWGQSIHQEDGASQVFTTIPLPCPWSVVTADTEGGRGAQWEMKWQSLLGLVGMLSFQSECCELSKNVHLCGRRSPAEVPRWHGWFGVPCSTYRFSLKILPSLNNCPNKCKILGVGLLNPVSLVRLVSSVTLLTLTSFPPLSKRDCFCLEIINAQQVHSWVPLILALSVLDCCHYTFLSNHLLADEPNMLLRTQSHSSFGSIYWAAMYQALFYGESTWNQIEKST